MPIKPENKKLYPKNWKQIRAKILERANGRCEFCGVENHAEGVRDTQGVFHKITTTESSEAYRLLEVEGYKKIKIVLTIAHLDHNPQNNSPDNLRALCQKCHNKYDAKHRAETRKKRGMTNRELLKTLDNNALAYTLVFDKEGNMRSPCGICVYYDCCTNDCLEGVAIWLEQEHKNDK